MFERPISSHNEWILSDKQTVRGAHKSLFSSQVSQQGFSENPAWQVLSLLNKIYFVYWSFGLPLSLLLPSLFLTLLSSLPACSSIYFPLSFPLSLSPSFQWQWKEQSFGVKISFKFLLSLMPICGVTFRNFHSISSRISFCVQGTTSVCLGWLWQQ